MFHLRTVRNINRVPDSKVSSLVKGTLFHEIPEEKRHVKAEDIEQEIVKTQRCVEKASTGNTKFTELNALVYKMGYTLNQQISKGIYTL